MGRQEWKSSGWKLTVAASGLALLAGLSPVWGKGRLRGQTSGGEDAGLQLTVRVYIYALVSQHEMATAKHVATRIYQGVGINLIWVDCPMTQPASQLNPACVAPHSSAEIYLNIVPDLAEGPRVGKYAMGYAVATPPHRGMFASVSYARACKQLLDTPGLTLGQLLGHGIAHEIGHLLLGTNSHSDSGLMSARWTAPELKLAAYMQLLFSDEQAAEIRRDVRARISEQASLQMAQQIAK